MAFQGRSDLYRLHVGNLFGTRTTEPFEPYFSAVAWLPACRFVLWNWACTRRRLLLVAKAKDDLDFYRVASPSHHVFAERHARIRAVWLLVGGVEALDSNPQQRPFNSKDCKGL